MTERDDTEYVQDCFDRAEPVPPGDYRIGRQGILIPSDYCEKAVAAGRVGDTSGFPVALGRVRLFAPVEGREEPMIIILTGAVIAENPSGTSCRQWIGRDGCAQVIEGTGMPSSLIREVAHDPDCDTASQ